MWVKLREDWQASTFNRRVRDAKGVVLLQDDKETERLLQFGRGVPVEITDKDELASIKADLEKGTLLEVVPARRGFVRREQIADGEVDAGEIEKPTGRSRGTAAKPAKDADLVGPEDAGFGEGAKPGARTSGGKKAATAAPKAAGKSAAKRK